MIRVNILFVVRGRRGPFVMMHFLGSGVSRESQLFGSRLNVHLTRSRRGLPRRSPVSVHNEVLSSPHDENHIRRGLRVTQKV